VARSGRGRGRRRSVVVVVIGGEGEVFGESSVIVAVFGGLLGVRMGRERSGLLLLGGGAAGELGEHGHGGEGEKGC